MKMDHSKFVERSFSMMDINSEGDSNMQLDVCEFFIGLCNLCFFPQDLLARYMFDLYDDDCNGSITVYELELMVDEVVGPGHGHLTEKLMKMLDGDGSLDISFVEFMKVRAHTHAACRYEWRPFEPDWRANRRESRRPARARRVSADRRSPAVPLCAAF